MRADAANASEAPQTAFTGRLPAAYASGYVLQHANPFSNAEPCQPEVSPQNSVREIEQHRIGLDATAQSGPGR
jgi:hypothetical protein